MAATAHASGAAIDTSNAGTASADIVAALAPIRAAVASSLASSVDMAPRAESARAAISAAIHATADILARTDPATARIITSIAGQATVNIGATLGAPFAAIAAAPSVPPARRIAISLSVRYAAPLGADPVVFWSPRVAGDVDTFGADFSPLLAVGEAIEGEPTISVPTGDLSVAFVGFGATDVSFELSGPGTPGAYSSVAIEAATTSGRTLAMTGLVVTTVFLPDLPNPDMGALIVPSPVFGPRAAGDADIYAVDFSPWLDVGETITGCTVSALTADLAVSQASYADSIVTWQASGSGAPGAWTAFLAVIKTSVGRSLGLYCGVRTARG